jgi:hypothetical protein
LSARFDRIFGHKTGFATLDRLLARLRANKSELLMVLERPDIPLHTNGSENDIRCQVTKREISGGTRSDPVVTVATLSSCSSRLAPRTASPSGIISAPVSPFQAATRFPPSPKSSAQTYPGLPERQDFCPSYQKST